MSYILNALRKSEQERQQNREQTLFAQLQPSRPNKAGRFTGWLMLLLSINVLLLAYFLWQYAGNKKKAAPNEATVAIKTTKTPAEPDSAKAVAGAIAQRPSKLLSIASLVQNKKPIIKTEPIAKATLAKKQSSEVVVAQKKEPETIITPTVKTVAETVSKTENKPTEELENNDIPWLDELPHHFRRNVPKPDINVYVYAERPENRFVIVSMQKYHTGQEIGAGMMLDEIQPDGIVVEYEGRRFKIRRD
ncbi:general secretion pathway protein GspB [Methylomarinum sp. Ch1-1]|uniref:General secretion pathway protein GspB n=1 Tax=Methylomarinum roseum TaxID=3067653 RepID=A0AAU7NWK7_9GAMM|nr:general secretion pathway protein GspB [Methylomarinum sp. Ch1-1]MDP4522557.1 general secretion pathway protein GspB [Methylomarinum sp. Ch1-1]